MGFDQRIHRRIPFVGHIRLWPDLENPGPSCVVGEAINLSESGLACTSERSIQKGERLYVEFRVPNQNGYLKLLSQVIHCEPPRQEDGLWKLRLEFLEQYREELVRMRRFILQTADPKLSSATGWGKTVVQGFPAVVAQYRELSADQFKLWLGDHSFLKSVEIAPLVHFQEFLEAALGNKTPDKLRLKGTRRPPEKSLVWVELALIKGSLRLVGETIWSKQDPEEDAEAGLSLLAYSKEDAMRFDKKNT